MKFYLVNLVLLIFTCQVLCSDKISGNQDFDDDDLIDLDFNINENDTFSIEANKTSALPPTPTSTPATALLKRQTQNDILLAELKDLFQKQTNLDISEYDNYEISNFPGNISTKQISHLKKDQISEVRKVFDSLIFVKKTGSAKRKRDQTFKVLLKQEKKIKIDKTEAQRILLRTYQQDTGHQSARSINWKHVDLSQLPEKYSNSDDGIIIVDKITRGNIFNLASLYRIPDIIENIHFVPLPPEEIKKLEEDPMRRAKRILLEKYCLGLNIPFDPARKILWNLVDHIEGLDGINYRILTEKRSEKIIQLKDSIKFVFVPESDGNSLYIPDDNSKNKNNNQTFESLEDAFSDASDNEELLPETETIEIEPFEHGLGLELENELESDFPNKNNTNSSSFATTTLGSTELERTGFDDPEFGVTSMDNLNLNKFNDGILQEIEGFLEEQMQYKNNYNYSMSILNTTIPSEYDGYETDTSELITSALYDSNNNNNNNQSIPINGNDKYSEDFKQDQQYVPSNQNFTLSKTKLTKPQEQYFNALLALFHDQTGLTYNEFKNYEIQNYPTGIPKSPCQLTQKDIDILNLTFDDFRFVKKAPPSIYFRQKRLIFKKAVLQSFPEKEAKAMPTSSYSISKHDAGNLLLQKYKDETGDSDANHIKWEQVDVSSIPERFSQIREIITDGKMFNYCKLYRTPEIMDNIHFIASPELEKDSEQVHIIAHKILLEKFRVGCNASKAKKIYWDKVKEIEGLEDVNYRGKKIHSKLAAVIIERKDILKFIPI